MRATTDDETAVIRTVWEEIDQPLQTSKSALGGILVLMRPWLVGRQILASSEAEVDSVEGDDQIFGVEDGFEDGQNTRFSADLPGEIFMGYGVVEAHSLVVDFREMLVLPCAAVVAVVA